LSAEHAIRVLPEFSLSFIVPQVSTTSSKPPKTQSKQTRKYFIIRSNCEANIEISVRESAWSTTRHNESKLNQAFEAGEVRLLFSVNSSGSFQGYAVMRSRVGQLGRPVLWDGGRAFGSPFAVEWKCLYNLPGSELHGLRNPLNDNMPVLKAKDGQELPLAIGDEVVSIMEKQSKAAGVPPPKQQVRLKGVQPHTSQQGGSGRGQHVGGQFSGRGGRGRGPGPLGGRGRQVEHDDMPFQGTGNMGSMMPPMMGSVAGMTGRYGLWQA
jgi:hypothetical protein